MDGANAFTVGPVLSSLSSNVGPIVVPPALVAVQSKLVLAVSVDTAVSTHPESATPPLVIVHSTVPSEVNQPLSPGVPVKVADITGGGGTATMLKVGEDIEKLWSLLGATPSCQVQSTLYVSMGNVIVLVISKVVETVGDGVAVTTKSSKFKVPTG